MTRRRTWGVDTNGVSAWRDVRLTAAVAFNWSKKAFLPTTPASTRTSGRIVNGTADLSGYFVDLTTNQTVEGVKTFTDGVRVSDLTSGRMVSAGTGGRLQTLDAAAARGLIGALAASEKGASPPIKTRIPTA